MHFCYHIRIWVLTAGLLLFSIISSAQKERTINIIVCDSLNNPVEGALITIETEENVGLVFGLTDGKGKAIIGIPDRKNLHLKISAAEFKIQKIPLGEINPEFSIKLKRTQKILPTVKVKGRKGPHVKFRNDSLIYAVKDFETRADRTIGDILRKLPGIEVESDGSISFRGRNISRLYIDGDDLLNSRYRLGTNRIQSSMVDSIQVIENDQPIKVLQNIEKGKSPAINLVLKPKARLVWVNIAELMGGAPTHYSGNLTNMAFKPAFKTLNALTAEEVGKNLIEETSMLSGHSSKPWLELFGSHNVLYDNKILFSDLPTSRWLFNKGAMGNLNTMFKIKPDHTLTINAAYLNQQDDESIRELSNFFLPGDTIEIYSSRQNLHKENQILFEIRNEINSIKSYWNNELKVQKSFFTNNGVTEENNNHFSIGQRFERFRISNNLSRIRLINNKYITELFSLTSYDQDPEQMSIFPGVLQEVLNNGNSYFNADQKIQYNKFYTSNAFGFKFIGSHLVQKYNAGFSLKNQTLKSDLSIRNQNSDPENKIKNKGNFHSFTPFAYSSWYLLLNKQSFELEILAALPVFKYNDDLLKNPLLKRNVQFNPKFSYCTKVGKENKFEINAGLDNVNEDIFTVYRGKILETYRNLSSQELPLLNSVTKTISSRFNFQKSLKIFFANIGIRYSQHNNHWIYKDVITENISITKAIPYENKSQNFSYFTGFSKYIFFFRTNFEFAYNGRLSKSIQFQNEQIFPVKNIENTFKVRFQKRFGKIAELNYKVVYSRFLSKYNDNSDMNVNTFKKWNNSVTLNITPNQRWLVNFELQHQKAIKENAISSLFADVKVRYTVTKWNLDFNFGVYNITGQKAFEKLYFSVNGFYKTTIQLRPRTFYVSTYFNF